MKAKQSDKHYTKCDYSTCDYSTCDYSTCDYSTCTCDEVNEKLTNDCMYCRDKVHWHSRRYASGIRRCTTNTIQSTIPNKMLLKINV